MNSVEAKKEAQKLLDEAKKDFLKQSKPPTLEEMDGDDHEDYIYSPEDIPDIDAHLDLW